MLCPLCSLHYQVLAEAGYRVEAFWYNPNIHPEEEHRLRLEATVKLLDEEGVPFVIDPGYQPSVYFDAVRGREKDRCKSCFRLRLEKPLIWHWSAV
jgi:predicted adenine nucleotide alpha hydrolase (AANH) superfamily ATPase